MKKRYVTGMIALSLCLGTSVAQAQYYYYLPRDAGPQLLLDVGPSFFQDSRLTQFGGSASSPVNFETGLAFDVAFGWAFNKYVATDFELGYIGAKLNSVPGYYSDNTRLYNIPFLVNVTFSYPIAHTILVPYVGAGVGGADMIFDTDSFSDGADTVVGSEDDVVLAGQVFAGMRFQLSQNFSLDLGYKYFATGDPTFTYPPDNFNVGFRGVRTHSILLSLVWKF